MLYETSSQALEAPVMMAAGMGMAAASLVFHMIRRLICAKLWLSLACDIMMGVVWSIIFCGALTAANRGSLRLYHILAAGAGAALFHGALGVPVRRICGNICRGAGAFRRKVCKNRFIQALIR